MFLVVFRNRKRASIDAARYQADAQAMEDLAARQKGFVSFKSYAAADGEVVAISEWRDAESARGWGRHPDHALVQNRGRAEYYDSYTLFTCTDPRITRFERQDP